jgi:hypothetical protein
MWKEFKLSISKFVDKHTFSMIILAFIIFVGIPVFLIRYYNPPHSDPV